MSKTVDCFKVPKTQGEKAIALAAKLGLIDKILGIGREADWLFIPLIRQPCEKDFEKLRQLPELEVTKRFFEAKKQPSESLTQALKGKLPPDLIVAIPQAFDIIGDIIILEIPKELKPHQNIVGEAILQTHRNIKTVLSKVGDISGIFRIRNYDFIAGEHRTSTLHKEFGCTYRVDVGKAYFSPRLSHEHERVAALVQSDELVVDFFAGVGPFSVLIGKKCHEAKVYAVDLNPEAVKLLEINVKANRVDEWVFAICADARKVAVGKLKGAADRVIMNLPETALGFVDAACNAIKPEGGIVHFYTFMRQPDTIDKIKRVFTEQVELHGRRVEAFLHERSIRETAPFESQIVLDAKIR
jgi:tRNA (guanine37-N1)-methyltransferase